MADDFGSRVRSRDVVIGVVGLGYVGLPLATAFAESGFRTLGFDSDRERIAALSDGISVIDDVSSERIGAIVSAGHLSVSSSPVVLAAADVVFICVPTPIDRAKVPDHSHVNIGNRTVAGVLRAGMLVILQSTTYPGTTTEIVQPILEAGGLRAGSDFHIAFSPERVDPGNKTWTVRNTPKVVGGLTPACTERAKLVLEAVMDDPGLVKTVAGPATAEMAKLLENTYRAVNIALVNEFAMLAHEMGIDVWEVIEAAASKPFGFQAFAPGVGPGGHCIPVDPHFLSWKAREFDFQTKFIEVAADVNAGMARYVLTRLHELMNRHERTLNGASVLCLGASFKHGVSDVRNSRAIRVMELLEEAGARVDYVDNLVPMLTLRGSDRKSLTLGDVTVARYDVAVVLVAGAEWPFAELEAAGVPVFDAVNASGAEGRLRERL